MVKKILKFCNENHWLVIGSIVLCSISFYFLGCESEVQSILTPGKKVHRDDLQTEFLYLKAQMEDKVKDLDRQDAIKMEILNFAYSAGQASGLPIAPFMQTLLPLGLLAFGLDRNYKLGQANQTIARNSNNVPVNPPNSGQPA